MTYPNPLVPADVDLRDFPCLQIDIVRLFSSEFHALSSDAEWRAGMTLWLKSFHQVPAASLPDDDTALARLAEFGRDQTSWKEAKAGALRNWVKCSDGRLYHPTVAIKALEAWLGKLWQRRSGAIGNAKRWKIEPDIKEYDDAYAAATAALAALDPRSNALSRHRPVSQPASQQESDSLSQPDIEEVADPDRNPNGDPNGDPIATPSQPDPDPSREPIAYPIASKGKGREDISISSLRSEIEGLPAREAHSDLLPADDRVVELRPKSAKSARAKKAQTAWPDDLTFGPNDRQFAEERGYRGRAADSLWDAFENHAKAKGLGYADWHAAWRTWVLNQVRFDGERGTAFGAAVRRKVPDV